MDQRIEKPKEGLLSSGEKPKEGVLSSGDQADNKLVKAMKLNILTADNKLMKSMKMHILQRYLDQVQ